jgi:putative SAM-dependent methyltransferase
MWVADNWKDYKVIDATCGEKLEKWGKYILIRPDPQVIWKTKKSSDWKQKNGHYHRSSKGGGEWEFFQLPNQWTISYNLPVEIFNGNDVKSLVFNLKPFSFKHTGVFPEQATNWDWVSKLINKALNKRNDINVLNLFAYTGGATISAAMAGAKVTHVDASKGMVNWAKENAVSSGLKDAPIRWIVDDCLKFVEREIRRGNTYDAIIMDPPSYGRGPKGEIWKIEDSIYNLISLSSRLLSKNPLFFLINSYTTGLQAGVLAYMLNTEVAIKANGASVNADEIGLPVEKSYDKDATLILPCGASGRCYWN